MGTFHTDEIKKLMKYSSQFAFTQKYLNFVQFLCVLGVKNFVHR